MTSFLYFFLIGACVVLPGVRGDGCPMGCYCKNRFIDCSTLMDFPTKLPEDTERIRMSHLNIRDIPPRAFSYLSNITSIEITNSNIANIQGCAFSDLESVRTIVFDKTVLGNIERYAFMGLNNLDLIQFEACRIGRIKEFGFYDVSDIDEFNLIDVNILNFYTHAFYNVSYINMMVWTKNNISDFVTGALEQVSHVKKFEVHMSSFWNMHCGVLTEIKAAAENIVFIENTFYCNCSVSWILNDAGRKENSWILSKNRCHGPDQFSAKPFLDDVMFSEIGCKKMEAMDPYKCKELSVTPDPKCPVPGAWSTWVTQEEDNKQGGDQKNAASVFTFSSTHSAILSVMVLYSLNTLAW